MTSRVDVGSGSVDLTVNDESRSVDRGVVSSHSVSFLVDPDHVRCLEETEMNPIRVDPKRVWFDRVWDSHCEKLMSCR